MFQTADSVLPDSFSVAFVSPIVLRRELETWLMADMKSLKVSGSFAYGKILF